MSSPAAEWSPPRAASALARRYWAFIYFVRRVVFLALLLWCALACVGALWGPRPVAAGAGLVCAGVVLYVQGWWVWRRYRSWVT